MSVTFELPELKLDDAFKNKMTTLDCCFDILKSYADSLIEVGVDPIVDGSEMIPKLWKMIHGTPCCR